jgi:hypothetical protein
MVNETVGPAMEALSYVFNALKFLLGGFLGLYIFLTMWRILAYMRLKKKLAHAFEEISAMKKRLAKLEKNKNLYTSKR